MESRNENKKIHADGAGLNNQQRLDNHRPVISPVSIRTARAFFAWTRHTAPPVGGAFAVGVQIGDGTLVGVAIIGWPTAPVLDDGDTAEVIGLAGDGTPGACAVLLRAAWRAAGAMGYRRMIAYTGIDEDEQATGLWDAGFRPVPDPRRWGLVRRIGSPGADGDVARVLWALRAAGGRP